MIYSSLNLRAISFVLFPQASEPSMNFNISKIWYLGEKGGLPISYLFLKSSNYPRFLRFWFFSRLLYTSCPYSPLVSPPPRSVELILFRGPLGPVLTVLIQMHSCSLLSVTVWFQWKKWDTLWTFSNIRNVIKPKLSTKYNVINCYVIQLSSGQWFFATHRCENFLGSFMLIISLWLHLSTRDVRACLLGVHSVARDTPTFDFIMNKRPTVTRMTFWPFMFEALGFTPLDWIKASLFTYMLAIIPQNSR